MEYTIIVIIAALIQYQLFGLRTGISRPKYNVQPPKTTGHETWERIFRVHQNTLEQLVVFIPGMLAFTYYVSQMWAVVLGIGFIIFRQYYSHMYVKNPPDRKFPLSFMINNILTLGSLIAVILRLIRGGSI